MPRTIPEFTLVVLGEGLGRRELEARISELAVGANAHLVGFEPEPLPFYAAADIYLRNPTMEGEKISSYHADALGLPAAGFDTCSETDLIVKLGHGVLVPNMDAAELASAVCRILSLRGARWAAAALITAARNLICRGRLTTSRPVMPLWAKRKGKLNGWMEGSH